MDNPVVYNSMVCCADVLHHPGFKKICGGIEKCFFSPKVPKLNFCTPRLGHVHSSCCAAQAPAAILPREVLQFQPHSRTANLKALFMDLKGFNTLSVSALKMQNLRAEQKLRVLAGLFILFLQVPRTGISFVYVCIR